MTEPLSELVAAGGDTLLVGFAVFLRVGAAMALLPAFGEKTVPRRVRLVAALAFTAIVAPAVMDEGGPPAGPPDILSPTLATEVVVGLALGAALRFFVHILQMVGAIAAQSTSLAQIFGGATGLDPMPAMGHLMVVAGLALAAILGLHVRVAEAFIQSYAVLPMGRFPDAAAMGEWGVGRVAHAFGTAFTLAAPFVIASAIYNTALGVINRAMPQLMVVFVGAPAITAGGLILLFLLVPGILGIWVSGMDAFLADPFGAVP